MAKAQIRPGTKRYSIALNEEYYEMFKSIIQKAGGATSTPAVILDTYIKTVVDVVNHSQKNVEPFSLPDVLWIMGAVTRRLDKQKEQLEILR